MSWWDNRKKPKKNTNWCNKHWEPFKTPNADGIMPNGVFAAVQLFQEFLDSPLYMELNDKSAEALNRHIEEAELPICCRLGEEVMAKIYKQACELGTRKEDYDKHG